MKERSGNRPVEEGDWRIGQILPKNLPHGRPVGSEVFLQPSANIALNKNGGRSFFQAGCGRLKGNRSPRRFTRAFVKRELKSVHLQKYLIVLLVY
ncbi:hypothetical protein C6Y45_08590 [Alkalicoccus saliphilus]|uniref:Uncharacterized protein n=1 Tax=Alkalicoccus saliphilus TaxID=200989 RepID=A0A2T4U6M6_9BACI|nr:hypothetical protein C6Y45_08590 [Alkalicoccus saliphilus]